MMKKQPPRCEGPLTSYIQSWQENLSDAQGRPLRQRLYQTMQGSKWSLGTSSVAQVFALVNLATADSAEVALPVSTMVLGIYSSMSTQILFWHRRMVISRCVAALVSALSEAERNASPSLKARMSVGAKRAWWFTRVNVCFAWATWAMVLHDAVAAPPSWGPATARWLASSLPGSDDRWAFAMHVCNVVGLCTGSLTCLTAYFTMLPFILVQYWALADVLTAIGERLREEFCSQRLLSHHGAALRACLLFAQCFPGTLPHIIMGPAIMSLASTVKCAGKDGSVSAYALSCMTMLLMVLPPLCEVGDRLAKSREGIATRAFEGPWLGETTLLRRHRLNLMLAALSRGAQVRARGLGDLNRGTCLDALKSWFSFLQMLLNVRSK